MWKKVVATVIVLLLALGGVFNAAADSTSVSSSISIIAPSNSASATAVAGNQVEEKNVKVTKEEAKQISLEMLRKHFGLEIDEKKYQEMVQLTPGYEIGKGYTWQLNWNMSNSDMFTHISTVIDASTGKFLGFNRSQSYRNQEQVIVADITKDQARKLTEEFLKKINPEEFKQVKLEDYGSEILYSSRVRPNYNFNFTREVNGLSYPYNYIMLGINGADGSIVNYSINWQYDLKLPALEGLVDKEKALRIFKDKFSMDLSYISARSRFTSYMAPTETKLVYTPSPDSGVVIDAKTGEALGYNDQKLDTLKKRDISQEQKNKMAEGKSKLSVGSGELTSEKAEAYINSLVKEFFGSGYKAENLGYSENEMAMNEGSRKTWTAEVMEDKPEAYQGKGTISIDSTSGEILNIGRYIFEDWYGKEYERKITWEQAYDKAAELLGKYYPHRLGDIRTEQIYQENLYQVNGKLMPDRMIYFNFPRLVNGIMYANNSINISIDTQTGEVNDLYHNWSKTLSFPKAEGIIDKEKAEEQFFKEFDVKLAYSRYNEKVNQNDYLPNHRIVYTLEHKQKKNSSRNIDAFSGKLLDYEGNELGAVQNNFYETIKGNPAEKELSILAFQNIIDTRSFKPDSEITYMELLRMLVNVKGYRPYSTRDQLELQFKNVDKKSENYPYLMEAVRYRIIENKPVELKLDAKVTREQMAEWIVKLLKYEKLAKAKGIFVLDYKDADEINGDLKGHVAIAKGLGIIDGTSEMFGPKENLKMQEAALIIYRALDSMREIK
ncbi:MAG TPA: YcdB/YcdC domain-containing protein [Clostridia bacterium]|nr:YcdB/YcdC domain-containing protein [Clostridia bacterium]